MPEPQISPELAVAALDAAALIVAQAQDDIPAARAIAEQCDAPVETLVLIAGLAVHLGVACGLSPEDVVTVAGQMGEMVARNA